MAQSEDLSSLKSSKRLRLFRDIATQSWLGYPSALFFVLIVSFVIGFLRFNLHTGNTSILYLIAVLASAVAFGRGPAVLASITAFLSFDWFFVEPTHTLTIGNVDEWISLLLFLITAIVTGQLTAGERKRAQDAEQREREAEVLYDVVRLMSEPDREYAFRAVAERLRHELELSAVFIEVNDSTTGDLRIVVGEEKALLLSKTKVEGPTQFFYEGTAPTASHRGQPGRWVKVMPSRTPGTPLLETGNRLHIVPICFDEKRIGRLCLLRPSGKQPFSETDDRLLSAIAVQVGIASERARLRQEATEAEILRRADELKTSLLNTVSHDLRTPLSSIIASAGSLRQTDVEWTVADRQEFAQAIEEEALRLNRIVGNLLDLSRMESGSLRPEKGWYDLGALVDDVLGRLKPLTARHQLNTNIEDNLPPILFDYVEIDQVLSNLVENATKYTQEGTEIGISIHIVGREVRVEVSDQGPGIPESALPHLFEPFFRALGQGPRPKGTGLGLAVAKGLVLAHGGRIWAENKSVGARFVFTLPLTNNEETPTPQEVINEQ